MFINKRALIELGFDFDGELARLELDELNTVMYYRGDTILNFVSSANVCYENKSGGISLDLSGDELRTLIAILKKTSDSR